MYAVGALLLLLIAVAAWVGIRAMLARDELLGAMPLAKSVASAAMSGDGATITNDVAELRQRASSAQSLTSDPIWRAAEFVPIAGKNLTAFREAAASVHDVAEGALPALAELAGTFSIDSFTPQSGNFDLEAMQTASPLLSTASASLSKAADDAAAIDTEGTVGPIVDAVGELKTLIDEADAAVGGLDSAAKLLPPMLGADGPRNYLILSLTNAELRASGGIPGAFVLITATDGRLGLGDVATTDDIGRFDEPVVALTPAETGLYDDKLAMWPQDVTMTPDFARAGEITRAMWSQRIGTDVDGVIALDPVVLGYILDATGPVDSGEVILDGSNTADVLLSSVYSMFEEPRDQDRFFARVTGQVFAKLMGRDASASALFEALARGAGEQRLHIWSAHAEEQEILAGTPLAGLMPESTPETTALAVYFNDSTASKMDYYLRTRIDVASSTCRNDDRPVFAVGLTMTSTAPADAATVLPAYVLGDERSGPLGEFSTMSYVYAPEGSEFFSVTIDGQEFSFNSETHDGRAVAAIETTLAPGQTALVQYSFVAPKGTSTDVALTHTPMFAPVETSVAGSLDCGELQPTPSDGTTGALSEVVAAPTRG